MADDDEPKKPDVHGSTMFILFLRILGTVIWRAFTYPLRGRSNKAQGWYKDIVYSALRTFTNNSNSDIDKFTDVPGEDAYRVHCYTIDQETQTTGLGEDGRGFWIGDKNADVVLLFLHGGGYINSLLKQHCEWGSDAIDTINKSGTTTASIVFLEYDLAPDVKYPGQLRQATAMLRHLIEVDGRDPSSIILVGDSAGGNLCLALMSHIAKPHPDVPRLDLKSPLRAAALSSPWVSFDVDSKDKTASVNRCRSSDILTASSCHRVQRLFLGDTKADNYAEPALADADWWATVAKGGSGGAPAGGVVRDVFVWGGGGEILLDGIREWFKKFEEGFKKAGRGDALTFVVTQGAAHDEMILDKMFGYRGEATSSMVDFVASRAKN